MFCNECNFLSVTEKNQKRGEDHICKKYDKKLYHKLSHPLIHRCIECNKETKWEYVCKTPNSVKVYRKGVNLMYVGYDSIRIYFICLENYCASSKVDYYMIKKKGQKTRRVENV